MVSTFVVSDLRATSDDKQFASAVAHHAERVRANLTNYLALARAESSIPPSTGTHHVLSGRRILEDRRSIASRMLLDAAASSLALERLLEGDSPFGELANYGAAGPHERIKHPAPARIERAVQSAVALEELAHDPVLGVGRRIALEHRLAYELLDGDLALMVEIGQAHVAAVEKLAQGVADSGIDPSAATQLTVANVVIPRAAIAPNRSLT